MSTQTFLIFGGGFFAGVMQKHLEKNGHSVTVLDFPAVDICQLQSVRDAITQIKPHYVINAAAYTNTKTAEQPEESSRVFQVNVQGPSNILLACREKGIPWLHISTGMIFDGQSPHQDGWREEDLPSPRGYYSWTKYWADQVLQRLCEQNQILIFRIHTPISLSANPLNLITKLTKFSSFVNESASMTVLEDLCRAFDHLRKENLTGLFHIANPGSMSYLQIAEQLQDAGLIPLETELQNMSFEQLNALGKTTGSAYQPRVILNTAKLQKTGITLPPIWERVGEIIDEMAAQA